MSSEHVNPEWTCVTCGYDLRSLDAEGRCPECGRPVLDSLTALGPVDLDVVPRLRGTVATSVALPFVLAAIMLVTGLVGGRTATIGLFAGLACVALYPVGTIVFGRQAAALARGRARFEPCMAIIIVCGAGLAYAIPSGQRMLVVLLTGIAALAVLTWAMLHARRIATLTRQPGTAVVAQIGTAFGLASVGTLGALVVVLVVLHAGVGADHAASRVVHDLFAPLVLIGAAVVMVTLLEIVLVRVGRRLERAAPRRAAAP
jgi:hypothetical protein